MTTPSKNNNRRPLLVNGERLRQQVNRPPGGGGPRFTPYTIEENIARLTPMIDEVQTAVAQMPAGLQGSELVVEARLLPQFVSASAFPQALLSAAGLVHIGTRHDHADTVNRGGEILEDQPTKTVYLAVRDDLTALADVLRDTAGRVTRQTRDDIMALDAIDLPLPHIITGLETLSGDGAAPAKLPGIVRDEDGLVLFEAALHGRPSLSGGLSPADDATRQKFAALVDSVGGRVETDWVRPAGALLFLPVRLAPEAAGELARFNPLRALQPMGRLRTPPSGTASGSPLPQPTTPPNGARAPLRIAVFDGGVDEASPYWQGRVRSPYVGNIVPDVDAQQHGAVVTSAIVYGHIDGATLPEPANVEITHFTTLPQHGLVNDLDMYWLLDVIEDQVRAGNFDVVTVCAAPERAVTDDPVHRWTSTLDNLSHEKGVLFVVAAGNNGAQPDALGLSRIQVPGDASNALAVGAADEPTPAAARALYSAIGPGRAGAAIRPSGIAFGGTDDIPFIAVDNDGTPIAAQGTSCAAPLVTRSLADLATRIGRSRISPVTMRAFALHFATECDGHELREVGHGRFVDDYAFLLDGPPNEAHILYQGTIARTEFIPLTMPVPDQRSGKLEIAYTLVTSTATEPADSVDYNKAGLEVTFRPHTLRYSLKNGNRTKTADAGTPQFAGLLASGWRPSAEPKSASIGVAGQSEVQLRDAGKWDSVRMGRHSYTQSQKTVFRPRIDLSHLARESGSLAGNPPDLDWALLVTLRAGSSVNLYDDVRTQYKVLTMLPAPTVTVATRTA
jgi:hypothetical protein